ncbi:MAG: coproporphyrinogen III oxidase family protein [Planctomycetes bacterium]|nr:coproporphyrinogen III oxidase family protein [Planctomycetota bacterium]
MRLTDHIRRQLRKRLTGEADVVLVDRVPEIERAFEGVEELGLYLHLPFCRRICPYCPYNKTLYRVGLADGYAEAVIREIDLYASAVGDRPITSFYVGGGTPTVMLDHGLDRILRHVRASFRMKCAVHMESHPTDLTDEALAALLDMGVEHLSVGVEALQDHHLRALGRPYTADEVRATVARTVARGFRCVNVDMMFALPEQTVDEVVHTGRALVDAGVDQVAAYPLFDFPYTPWTRVTRSRTGGPAAVFTRRKMLKALEHVFYGAGFRRTSVWAFTRAGVSPYCSVTVPLYLGIGASGGSYLRDVFFLNTFDVGAYIESLERGRLPVALSVKLSRKMQMAGWLYWRMYGVRFRKRAFLERFGTAFDAIYGREARSLGRLGLLRDDGTEITLTDAGAYWLHVVQDIFSLDAVGKLWGTAMTTPWPRRVVV